MKTPKYIQERIVYKKQLNKYAEAPAELEYLKKKIEQCEDCGKRCETRVINLEWMSDIKAWNKMCSVCTRYLDVSTGEFDKPRTAAKIIIKQEQKKRDK